MSLVIFEQKKNKSAHVLKKKQVKGKIYYDLVKSKRQGQKVAHEHLVYLGDLSDMEAGQQEAFVWRMERLMNGQLTATAKGESVESQALHFFGKYFQKHQSGTKQVAQSTTEGGSLLTDQEERINLKSLAPLEIRETGAEWLCWQAMEHLGLPGFLSTHASWSEKEQGLMLLNLMGRLLYPVSERKTSR